MNYPKHTDERAYEFFTLSYTGKRESRFNTSYDEDIASTYARMNGKNVCIYCGNSLYPLQRGLVKYKHDIHADTPSYAYKTTGYACVCKGACDEREVRKMLMEEEERHLEAVQKIKDSAPTANVDIFKKERIESMQKAIKEIEENPNRDLFFNADPGGFDIVGPG